MSLSRKTEELINWCYCQDYLEDAEDGSGKYVGSTRFKFKDSEFYIIPYDKFDVYSNSLFYNVESGLYVTSKEQVETIKQWLEE